MPVLQGLSQLLGREAWGRAVPLHSSLGGPVERKRWFGLGGSTEKWRGLGAGTDGTPDGWGGSVGSRTAVQGDL